MKNLEVNAIKDFIHQLFQKKNLKRSLLTYYVAGGGRLVNIIFYKLTLY